MGVIPRRVPARVWHPVFARCYGWLAPAMERHGAAHHRERLLAGAAGRVIEIGAGTGANLAHLPDAVTEVLAVEPEAHLRRLAEKEAERLAPGGPAISVVDGLADALPAADGAFDAAVVTLVLCTVPDQAAALAELRRVLRPGGRLYFWEHVRAEERTLARVQRAMDATVWPALGGGCHVHRDTEAAIRDAGFDVERVDRFRFPDEGPPLPPSPQILGVAVRR